MITTGERKDRERQNRKGILIDVNYCVKKKTISNRDILYSTRNYGH